MSKITVVGCGTMGSALVNSFMSKGHEVTIVDINKDATSEYTKKGAKYFASLCDALYSDFIVLNVPTYDIAKNIVTSCTPEQLKGKLFLNLTTGDVNEVTEFGKIMQELGAIYLEGAIVSYPADIGTENGNIAYSGNEKVFRSIEDALKAISPSPMYLGEDIKFAAIFDFSDLVLLYAMYWGAFSSVAVCMRNGFPIDTLSKYLPRIVPAVFSGLMEEMQTDLVNYTGEYADSDVASVEIQSHALKIVVDTLKSNKVDASVAEAIDKLVDKTIAAGYGGKNFEAVFSQMYK